MSSTVVTEKNITSLFASSIAKPENDAFFSRLRNDALAVFESTGLPGAKNEEYKHTPFTRLLEKNISFPFHNVSSSTIDFGKVALPGVDGSVIVLINGKYSHEFSIIKEEQGLNILSIAEALKNDSKAITDHLGKIADFSKDSYVAFNTAAWTDGIFIQIADNVQVSSPVLIYNIHDAAAGQVISSTRNIILVGKNSEVTVLEKFDSIGSSNSFSNVVTEAFVNENAGLTLYSIQNDNGNRYHFEHKQIQQAKSSRVNTYTFTLEGKAVRNNLHLGLEGEGIDSHMYGLYLIGKDNLADNHTVVDHRQPNSFSNELYKGILEDSAKGVFNGKIYVRPHAQKTNAFQANRNILLTDKATVNTKPQLEIWADDVKCSHGCTSGQLDEEALFYLQTRGIGKETARAMMLYAFAAELLETMKDTSIKKYIDGLISERLHKTF